MGTVKNLFGTVCENCPLCKYARNNPETPLGKIMEWHGKWCPAWQGYLEKMEQEGKKVAAKAN